MPPEKSPDEKSRREWFEAAYADLRRRAEAYFANERASHTLQPTALVHEAFLRLADQGGVEADRGRFLALTASAMRNALVDHARSRNAAKRGGDRRRAALEVEPWEDSSVGVLELEDAFARFASLDPRRAQVAEMKIFAGAKETEIAAAIGMSIQTVQSDWALARAWLTKELR